MVVTSELQITTVWRCINLIMFSKGAAFIMHLQFDDKHDNKLHNFKLNFQLRDIVRCQSPEYHK